MKSLAKTIQDRYGINDPFTIAKLKNIMVIAEPLGKLHGYISNLNGHKMMHINDALHPTVMEYVASYLLCNEFVNGLNDGIYIQRPYQTMNENELNSHKFANHFLNRQCNNVLEQCNKRLNHDEIQEITTLLDRVWFMDTQYNRRCGVDKLHYVLCKFI